MRSFSRLTTRARLLELVRWLAVLPAAGVGQVMVALLLGTVFRTARHAGAGMFDSVPLADWFLLIVTYAPPTAAFVLCGSLLAPRSQRTTSIVLAVLGLGLSLLTHLIGPAAAGNRFGLVNVFHLLAESLGFIVGVAVIASRTAGHGPMSTSDTEELPVAEPLTRPPV